MLEFEGLHGCYLLHSNNLKFKGRTYIGYTVNPVRRIGQHNGGHSKGGARRTSKKGPWDMLWDKILYVAPYTAKHHNYLYEPHFTHLLYK